MRLLLIAIVSILLVTFRSAYAAEVEGINGGVYVDARPSAMTVSFVCNGSRITGNNVGNFWLNSRGKSCQLQLNGQAVVGATITRISGGKLKLGDAFYADGTEPAVGGDFSVEYRVSGSALRLRVTPQQQP